MKAGTHNHVKTKRLMRLLNIPSYAAVGILESMWLLCTDCCDEGQIGKFTDEEIADYMGWDGPQTPAELMSALHEAGWLDQDEGCRWQVHDWLEHCPEYIRDRVQKRRAREAKKHRSATANHQQTTYVHSETDSGGQSRTKPDKVRQPPSSPELVPSIPNPTNPNQSNSNPSPPSPQSGQAATADDDDGGPVEVSWGQVEARLIERNVACWRESAKEARACGCTPELAMKLLDYADEHKLANGAVVFRFARASPAVEIFRGWPVPDSEVQNHDTRIERREQQTIAKQRVSKATQIIKNARRDGKTDDQIREQLQLAGLEWPA